MLDESSPTRVAWCRGPCVTQGALLCLVQYTAGIPSSSGLGIEKGISKHCFVYTLLSGSRSAHRAVVVVWYDLSASCYLCSTHAGWAEPCMCLNMNLQKLGLRQAPFKRSLAGPHHWQVLSGQLCVHQSHHRISRGSSQGRSASSAHALGCLTALCDFTCLVICFGSALCV